ncbi:MAG: M20/M25/M40 family metallo-hydrolase [Rubrivivax sp.]|nr:M20/M25/M40 family metallo-hydrolase [Rubrivivax sp.]
MTHPLVLQRLLRPLALAVALAAGLAAALPARAAPAWLTLSADALVVLQRMVPQTQVLGQAEVAVARPLAPRSAALEAATETIVAVEVDDQWLEMLSLMVHRELQRCGGYVFHASRAEALATLHRLSGSPAEPTAVGPAPSYAIDNATQILPLMPLLQASHLMATVDSLPAFQNRRYNSTHGVAASDWLAERWRTLIPATRRDARVVQITHAGWPQKSVMVEILGTTRADEMVVLGGHLDSIAPGTIEGSRAPGADDNASGIASLTEVIRVMMAGGYRPSRTLRFIAYAAEEVGLRGSGEIAADFLGRADKVVGVMQLDMTAFQGDSTDIWLYTDYTNAAQNAFLATLVSRYLPGYTVGYSACGYACSDHASWHTRGFRASFPHEASNANYNRAIHTVDDVTAIFGNDPQHMLKFTKLALVYAVELGTLPRGSRGALAAR